MLFVLALVVRAPTRPCHLLSIPSSISHTVSHIRTQEIKVTLLYMYKCIDIFLFEWVNLTQIFFVKIRYSNT